MEEDKGLEELLNQAKDKYAELESEFNKFAELKADLQNKSVTITNFYSDSELKNSELTNILEKNKTNEAEILDLKVKAESLMVEINNYFAKFSDIRDKLEDENDGMEVNLVWSQEKKEEISKKYEEIIKIQNNSENLKNDIEKYKLDVEKIKEKSEEFKNGISETLELITASSLQNEFNNRKREINKSLNFWKWFLMGGLFFLFIAIMYIYYLQVKTGGFKDWNQWYRYLFTAPIIYLVYISSKNYNIERDLLEKYSFKAVLSTSLRSYIKLFNDYFEDRQEEILKFTLSSVEKIYKEPYTDKDTTRKISLGGKTPFNISLEEAEIKNIVKSIPVDEVKGS